MLKSYYTSVSRNDQSGDFRSDRNDQNVNEYSRYGNSHEKEENVRSTNNKKMTIFQ